MERSTRKNKPKKKHLRFSKMQQKPEGKNVLIQFNPSSTSTRAEEITPSVFKD